MKKWKIEYAWQVGEIEPEEASYSDTEEASTLQEALNKFLKACDKAQDKVVIFAINPKK